jgi:hypothetical protein
MGSAARFIFMPLGATIAAAAKAAEGFSFAIWFF